MIIFRSPEAESLGVSGGKCLKRAPTRVSLLEQDGVMARFPVEEASPSGGAVPGRQLSSPGGAASIDEEEEEESHARLWLPGAILTTVCVCTDKHRTPLCRKSHARAPPTPPAPAPPRQVHAAGTW